MNELYHHGVIGQKWGVRRYQNADGTLTAEGRRRYGYEGHMTKKGYKELRKADYKLDDFTEKHRYLKNFIPKEYESKMRDGYSKLLKTVTELGEMGYYSDPEVKDEKRTNELIKLYVKQTSELKKIMRDCADIVLKDAKVKNQKEIDRFMSDMAGMLDDELD